MIAFALSEAEKAKLVATGFIKTEHTSPRLQSLVRQVKEPKYQHVLGLIERDIGTKMQRIRNQEGWQDLPMLVVQMETYRDALAIVRDRLQPIQH